MASALVGLESLVPYSQSAPVEPGEAEKRPNETEEQKEERIWRLRTHLFPGDKDGMLAIPAVALMKSIQEGAQKQKVRIKGKGTSTYGAIFAGGFTILRDLPLLRHTRDGVKGEWIFVHGNPSNPKAGRVWRKYPVIEAWHGDIEINVFDAAISEDVLRSTIDYAGLTIGIGRWRPANRGQYGRFKVTKLVWKA